MVRKLTNNDVKEYYDVFENPIHPQSFISTGIEECQLSKEEQEELSESMKDVPSY